MQTKTIVFFINGILTNPGDSAAWTDRAVTWFHTNTTCRAEKFEYLSSATFRFLFQNARAENLLSAIKPYLAQKWRIFLVGHSNGAELICRVLRKTGEIIDGVYLIAGATDADMRSNGISNALMGHRLNHASFFCSKSDTVLKSTFITRWFPKWTGLGYGNIGLIGPKHISMSSAGKIGIIWKEFGHSEWFSSNNFDNTMKEIYQSIKRVEKRNAC